MAKRDPRERFLLKVPHRPEGECWIWQGGRSSNGYGVFNMGNGAISASRAAYILFVATSYLRGKVQVCHICDNPPCVNPAHLFLATAKGNMRDCIEKGRRPKTNPRLRKLTDAQREEVCRRHPAETTRALGLAFGVSHECIRKIIRRAFPRPAKVLPPRPRLLKRRARPVPPQYTASL